jgi:hypothetical protein
MSSVSDSPTTRVIPDCLEASLVELVVAVSEVTEDETEIFECVDRLVASGRVRLRPHL